MLFLVFQLNDDRYALDVSQVVEVLPLVRIRKMLRSPPGIAGTINYRGAHVPVVDLSELALGWMTYGVGDHMSHYNVNVSVSKTLIQHLIRWVVASGQFDAPTSATLQGILDTEISPELVPHAAGDSTRPAQKTAETVGPYELQDFNLYFITRYGFRPSKVAFLASHATRGSRSGTGCARSGVTRNSSIVATSKNLFMFVFPQSLRTFNWCNPKSVTQVFTHNLLHARPELHFQLRCRSYTPSAR